MKTFSLQLAGEKHISELAGDDPVGDDFKDRKVEKFDASYGQSKPIESSPLPAQNRAACAVDSRSDPDDDEAAQRLAAEVRLAQAGDDTALNGLIESNRAWVRGIAYTVLCDSHLAEDAAQDVCVRMVKHLHTLDAPAAFRPWLYRMTRNVALSMAQQRKRAPQTLGVEIEEMTAFLQGSKDDPPGATLEADEGYNAVLETIHRLPQIYREVLVLKHVKDLSYAELSAILGVNIKSLEVRLVRARKLLQIRLGRCFKRRRKHDPGSRNLEMNAGFQHTLSKIPA
jgi:RNA polymerase sigma-70 factor (ECF subfamily)